MLHRAACQPHRLAVQAILDFGSLSAAHSSLINQRDGAGRSVRGAPFKARPRGMLLVVDGAEGDALHVGRAPAVHDAPVDLDAAIGREVERGEGRAEVLDFELGDGGDHESTTCAT